MKSNLVTSDAYKLFQDGTLIMEEMERNGICIDMKYLLKAQQDIEVKIQSLNEKLKNSKVGKKWRRKYGDRTKFGSRDQLADILFNVLKYPTEGIQEGKTRISADAEALEDINLPFVKDYVLVEKLKKAKNTYLENIKRETVNGVLHPNFGLNLARTFRGQSDHPNFTNIPVRDPVIKEKIRRCFIPRPGNCIVDLDFKGSEVNAASWYHHDPVVIKYIKTDPGRMHTDAAGACYLLPNNLITKDVRYCGKNKFVFPEFYGDWWLSCAKNLWFAIDRMNLQTSDGIPLKKWLKSKGIKRLGSGDPNNIISNSFEAHIKKVEHTFWFKKFKVYSQWKEDWWEEYQRKGYFKMLTGFVIFSNLSRKDCINYPIQGTAFHCLLWCLIRINQLLKKYKMKSRLIGQIHDSAVGDVPEKELKDYIDIALNVITVELKKHWSFISTPISAEVEVTPVNKSWYEKSEYKI